MTLSLALLGVRAELKYHDHRFTPDYVLEASESNITINCESRHSVTINGTSPGPPLYLKEGKTAWVRVYNRMPEQNLTMVRLHSSRPELVHSVSSGADPEVALAWPCPEDGTFL